MALFRHESSVKIAICGIGFVPAGPAKTGQNRDFWHGAVYPEMPQIELGPMVQEIVQHSWQTGQTGSNGYYLLIAVAAG